MGVKSNLTGTAEDPLFREFEHTGDLGIELAAPTRSELFRRAVVALAAVFVEPGDVASRDQRLLVVEAATDADLMHDLLTELLHVFTVEGFIWCDAEVEGADRELRVRLCGEPFDPARHAFRTEIKAVTYHELTVEESSDGWRARIILDV